MHFQVAIRLTAWCIAAVAIGLPFADFVGLLEGKRGAGLDSSTRSLWIATLIGIPCVLIGLKGVAFGVEANRTRRHGLLIGLSGVVLLFVSGLLTFVVSALDAAFNLKAGILVVGPLAISLVLIYAGFFTVVSGVDITEDLRR